MPDLFYRDFIQSTLDTQRWVERPWLAERLAGASTERNCRYLLLIAQPGAGKTAFMAWLADQNPGWLRYFIRRDSQALLSGGDARSFLFAIGHQLAALRPELFRSEQLQIVVEQRIGAVKAGSRAAGIQVEDLQISPFFQTAIKVKQDVGFLAGEFVGLSVKRLVAEERFLSLENLQYLALLDPASALLRQDSSARITILVDALDELRYQPGQESVLNWLAAAPELPENVQIVLTSRPDAMLDHFRRRQAPWLKLETIDLQSVQVREDLRNYAEKFISLPAVKAALSEEKGTPRDFVEGCASRAEGNFQYLQSLFRGIDQALKTGQEEQRKQLLHWESIPNGLEELYAFFLALIKDRAEAEQIEVGGGSSFDVHFRSAWQWLLQPILGVLAVSREPLELRQISSFGHLRVEERWVQGAIEQLGQFLDRESGRYRLYHSTLPEFLTSEATRDKTPDCYLDPVEWHRKIAVHYRGKSPAWEFVDWRQVDDYGLMHLPFHLYSLRQNPELRSELYGLFCKPYMQEKLARTLSHRAFSADLELAIEAASGDTSPTGLGQLARACLIFSTLGSLAGNIQPSLLAALVLAGQTATALGYVALVQDPQLRSQSNLLIAESLLSRGELEAGKQVLRQALDAGDLLQASGYAQIAQAFARAGDTAGLRQVLETIRSTGSHERRAIAVREVSQVFIHAGETGLIWEAAASIEDRPTRAAVLCAMAPALAESGDYARLHHIIKSAREVGFDSFAPSSLGGLAHALAAAGDREGMELAVSEALLFTKAQDKAQALSGIAQALARRGELAVLNQMLDKVGEIDDIFFRVKTVTSIAGAFGTAGYREDALEILDWVKIYAEDIESHLDRALALSQVSRVFSTHKEQPRAAETARRALEAALEKDVDFDISNFASAFANLAAVMQQASDPGEINRAMTGFGSFTDQDYRDTTLIEVIQALIEAREFDLCFSAFKDFYRDRAKAPALVDLAAALAREGDMERLGMVQREAEELRDGDQRVNALSGVASALIHAGDRAAALKGIEEAGRSLERVGQEREKSEALAEIIPALVRVKDEKVSLAVRERSVALAEAIPSEVRRCAAMKEMVLEFIAKGDGATAAAVAKRCLACAQAIDYETDRIEALDSAMQALLLVNDREGLQNAAAAGDAFENGFYQIKALSRLAAAYARIGEMEKATEAAKQVLGRAETEISDISLGMAEAAHALVHAGYQEGIERLMAIVQGMADEQRRKSALEELAPVLAQANERELLLRCLTIAETIEDDIWAPIARGIVIRALLKLDDPQHDAEIISRALSSIDTLGMDVFENAVLSDFAVALARIGNLKDLDRVLAELDALADEKARASTLTRIARALAGSGDREGTQAFIERTLKTIQEIYYEGDRSLALSSLAVALSEAGDGEKAVSVARHALVLVEELQSGWFRCRALGEISRVMAQAGDGEGLRRILAAAHPIEEFKDKASALVHVAAALSDAGEQSWAMQVLREALPIARLAGREAMFEMMKDSAGVLAADGKGEGLWVLYEVVLEVEEWWRDPPFHDIMLR